MESVSIGGRRYTDPDIISLIRETGELIDPRSAVLNLARRLNSEFQALGGTQCPPLERLKMIASLRGLILSEMDSAQAIRETRDAVLLPSDGKGGHIYYNPTKPQARIAFSIAHEISHTFFPNSIHGARFRVLCNPDSREGNELERLCDLGAAEILMPLQEFRKSVAGEFGLACVDRVAPVFGSSFEATVFRLATAYDGLAAAGLLRYRLNTRELRVIESRKLQMQLFPSEPTAPNGENSPKYRRQSFFMSETCKNNHVIPWNKSFDPASCVYRAGQSPGIFRALEELPNAAKALGNLEALRAPYQRDDADATHADVLFLWWRTGRI
jgi:hypothetical protein